MRHDIRTDLDALERDLLAAIDDAARSRMPAHLPVHAEKERQAEALMANPAIADGEIPHIAGEAAREGLDRFDVAVAILTRAQEDRQVSAAIDGARLAAKARVRAADTPMGKRRMAQVNWPDVKS